MGFILPTRKYTTRESRIDFMHRMEERLNANGAIAGASTAGSPPMGAWSVLASQPAAWKAALFGGKLINYLPTKLLPVPALRAWENERTLPK